MCVNSCTCISLFTPASCVLVAADFGQKRLGRYERKLIGSFLDFMHKACIRQHLCVHTHVSVCKGSSSFIHGADLAADPGSRILIGLGHTALTSLDVCCIVTYDCCLLYCMIVLVLQFTPRAFTQHVHCMCAVALYSTACHVSWYALKCTASVVGKTHVVSRAACVMSAFTCTHLAGRHVWCVCEVHVVYDFPWFL